jgi:UTP--glucose-1-phosphate uridylyltransferase
VKGDWTFEEGVVVKGAGSLTDQGQPSTVAGGTVIEG